MPSDSQLRITWSHSGIDVRTLPLVGWLLLVQVTHVASYLFIAWHNFCYRMEFRLFYPAKSIMHIGSVNKGQEELVYLQCNYLHKLTNS